MSSITITHQNNAFSCLPEKGGAISSLILNGIEIIDFQPFGEDFKGNPSAVLFPFASRIPAGIYEFQGRKYQLPINERTRPNAIHGLVNNSVFEVIEQTANSLTLCHNFSGITDYPFQFKLTLTYCLNDTQFCFRYKVENTGNSDMPCAFGWHPYFRAVVDDCSLEIPATAKILLDENMIAYGEDSPSIAQKISLNDTVLDNGFRFITGEDRLQTRLKTPDYTLTMIQQTGLGKLNYLVIFTPPSRKSIAIEPLSGNINCFNTKEGLVVLPPKQSWENEVQLLINLTL